MEGNGGDGDGGGDGDDDGSVGEEMQEIPCDNPSP